MKRKTVLCFDRLIEKGGSVSTYHGNIDKIDKMTKQLVLISSSVSKNETRNCVLLVLLTTTLSIFCVAYLYIYFYTELLQYKCDKQTKSFIAETNPQRLVCYYSTPTIDPLNDIRLNDVPGELCTHINIGFAYLQNSSIVISSELLDVLQEQLPIFRAKNPNVKLLLCIGGANSGPEFSAMVANHDSRKTFLRSLRDLLKKYPFDGIDLDWEFPNAYNKEREHLSQLMYEIRKEWQREHRQNRLLSLAVAAPEGIAFFAYDISELNKYVNYVNLMTYDFHFYSESSPFTGLNAPLFARSNEHSILATININYSVHWWLNNGLEPQRLVVGLPTYGHSFTLVNPFNNGINAPASGHGRCGRQGFTSYSETCHCATDHLHVTRIFDNETCSPYLTGNDEWISYENQESIKCKAAYIRRLNVGGIMIFSLNSDDINNYCDYDNDDNDKHTTSKNNQKTFPLVQIAKDILKNH